jgi:NAD(P)-dependent dehydrogenase (short-subunit alcohol dehydrogenase family)
MVSLVSKKCSVAPRRTSDGSGPPYSKSLGSNFTGRTRVCSIPPAPLGHVLEPEDFAGPILFLASDAASYITGQAINVNCGSYMT